VLFVFSVVIEPNFLFSASIRLIRISAENNIRPYSAGVYVYRRPDPDIEVSDPTNLAGIPDPSSPPGLTPLYVSTVLRTAHFNIKSATETVLSA